MGNGTKGNQMRIGIGNDHAGCSLRQPVIDLLNELGHEVVDFGADSPEPIDYPDVAVEVARAVAAGDVDLGILICGTGIGMSMSADKVAGVYAAACSDCFSARLAREHTGANVLCIGGRVVGPGLAQELVTAFLNTQPSSEDRHVRRRQKMSDIC